MKVFDQRLRAGEIVEPTAVALGFFDGVHLGHQAVIAAAREAAQAKGLKLAVFTFSQPVREEVKGKQIMNSAQKHEVLESLGVDYCFEPPFESFRALTPEAFFDEMLVGEYRAQALACGVNFGFGARRAGTPALLGRLCERAGLALAVVPTLDYQGEPVSSSRIRAAIAEGNMPEAAAMLGRPFEIEYPVRHGKSLGGKLGFPTLNQVFPEGVQTPAFGVYVTQTVLGDEAWPSATGYGTRPTVDGGAPTCETFIPGFSGNLYGKRVKVRFYEKIADTQKFPSFEALAAAVQGWARQAKAYFSKEGASS